MTGGSRRGFRFGCALAKESEASNEDKDDDQDDAECWVENGAQDCREYGAERVDDFVHRGFVGVCGGELAGASYGFCPA